MTLAEMLDRLECGRMGHREAMEWLGVDTFNDLVDIVHLNGRRMPGHRATPMSAETRGILRLVTRPAVVSGPR